MTIRSRETEYRWALKREVNAALIARVAELEQRERERKRRRGAVALKAGTLSAGLFLGLLGLDLGHHLAGGCPTAHARASVVRLEVGGSDAGTSPRSKAATVYGEGSGLIHGG